MAGNKGAAFHLVGTLVVLILVAMASTAQVSAKIALFNSNSGVTKPEKKKHPSTCPPDMVAITNEAFKHALKKDVYESKKQQSIDAFGKLNFSTCAVVGNGGTLQTTKYGKSIDSHEIVFRANQAPVKRYEDRVGSKTTFRILNKRWLGTYSANVGYLPLERGVFLTTSRGDQKVVDTLYRKHKDNPKVNVITMSSKISGASRKVLEEFKDYVKCHKRGKAFHGGSTISSGLYEVFMALSLCDKVTVYGFGNGGHGLYQYYKFRNTERKTGDSVHSFDAEKALVMQLERDGFLKTCFGKSKEGNDCGNQHKDKNAKASSPLAVRSSAGEASSEQNSVPRASFHQERAPVGSGAPKGSEKFTSADQAMEFLQSMRDDDEGVNQEEDHEMHEEIDKILDEHDADDAEHEFEEIHVAEDVAEDVEDEEDEEEEE
ncbi:sialyltransferase [Chloropicon primus]|uniref:Sialyltransferase n=1 Tax=Chloropicon primus TaxID=1764295 RepID=A0A5B8MD91_9CHLO|nr:sialyltransferase [Chloropicon primus]UPQ97597.1 sialyltransferase [Chloropicon primus]|eukprot:QDZ18387.1 sialyltransferase [Chloropicon primus]